MQNGPDSAGLKNTVTPTIPAGEPNRSMRLAIMEGLSSIMYMSLTGGALLTAYAIMLGANDFHLGLLTAISAFSTGGTLISSQLLSRIGSRKRLIAPTALLCRLPIILLIAIPFMPVLPGWRLVAFLGIIFFVNILQSMTDNLWLSWMTDLVPLEMRGRYFSRRNVICSLAAMIATYGIGSLYDLLKERWDPTLAFLPLLAASAVFAILSAKVLQTQWEPPLQGEKPISLVNTFRIPFANPNFRKFMAFLIPWTIMNAVAGPFYVVYMIKNLQMSQQMIAIYPIFSSINLLTQLFWGRIIDRVGNRPVLVFNILFVFLLPIIWIFSTPVFLLPIWIDAVLTGIFKPGIELTMFNLNMNAAPRENRTSYFAVQSIVSGLAVSTGSLIGGLLAYILSGMHFQIGRLTLINFHVLFLITGLGRLIMIFAAMRLHEERARPVGVLVGMITQRIYDIVGGTVQIGITTIQTGVTFIKTLVPSDSDKSDDNPSKKP